MPHAPVHAGSDCEEECEPCQDERYQMATAKRLRKAPTHETIGLHTVAFVLPSPSPPAVVAVVHFADGVHAREVDAFIDAHDSGAF